MAELVPRRPLDSRSIRLVFERVVFGAPTICYLFEHCQTWFKIPAAQRLPFLELSASRNNATSKRDLAFDRSNAKHARELDITLRYGS